MRKYKQVHRKEIDFDLDEWAEIERKAADCHVNTTKYLRRVIKESSPSFYDMKELAPVLNGMRVISNNINQIARRVNATDNFHARDVEKIQKEVSELSHTLNTFVSTLTSRKV